MVLPSFAVDAVVHVPYGAHPTSCFPRYGYDTDFHRRTGLLLKERLSLSKEVVVTPPQERDCSLALALL